MSAKEEERDPLSLLADDSSSSESECEDGIVKGKKSLRDKSYYTPEETGDASDKLPSPDTLFSTVKKPEFLSTHVQENHVNWDHLVKNIDQQAMDHATEGGGKFSAVPPPPQHKEEVDPRAEISSAPVKYAVPEMTIDPKHLTVSSNTSEAEVAKGGVKRPQSDVSSSNSKKTKGNVFKEKEKRKRDLGMSSRGKRFVEEEKRILREQFDIS